MPTVSKVLNGRADVAPATRAKVEALIDKHRYRRRRGNASTGAQMVDLVFHELDSPWALEIIRGVERVAREEHLSIVLSECGGAHTPRQEWLEGVLSRKPDEVTMVFSDLDPSQRRQLEARNIPCVVIDTTGEPTGEVPAIGSANWNDGLAATRHLLELGHRRIAVIGGPARVRCSRARIDGYRAALEDAEVQVDPDLICHGTSTSRAATSRASSSSDSRIAPQRSSPGATYRRSACTGPPARWGFASTRTSPSSGTTTCPSPSGSAPP